MNTRARGLYAGKRGSGGGRRAHRRPGLYAAFTLSALMLWPALATASPPVLSSVTVPLGGNHPTSQWTLPAGVTSQFIQTSQSSEVNEDGYFGHLVNFNVVDPNQTAFTDQFEFQSGVYYLHVAGHDKKCFGGACPSIEFSDVVSFQVPGVGSGPGGGLPPTSGGPGPDKVAPIEVLSFAPVQDVDKLLVRARMSEAGRLTARASVSVAGASKVYRFKTVSRSATANVSAKLRLKLAKKQLKAVKRALKKGKRLRAKVTVTATDRAKNKKSQKATIRLKN
jgi:hypothetical protein